MPLVEEETVSHYKNTVYYPAYPSQLLNDRYRLRVKLGFGGGSTVWLSNDQT